MKVSPHRGYLATFSVTLTEPIAAQGSAPNVSPQTPNQSRSAPRRSAAPSARRVRARAPRYDQFVDPILGFSATLRSIPRGQRGRCTRSCHRRSLSETERRASTGQLHSYGGCLVQQAHQRRPESLPGLAQARRPFNATSLARRQVCEGGSSLSRRRRGRRIRRRQEYQP